MKSLTGTQSTATKMDWTIASSTRSSESHRLVGENPRAWTEIEAGVRRAVLRRFPYSLIYVLRPNEALVLAVAHHSRRPGYWRDRRP